MISECLNGGKKANLKDEYLFSNSGDNWREDVGNEQRKMK